MSSRSKRSQPITEMQRLCKAACDEAKARGVSAMAFAVFDSKGEAIMTSALPDTPDLCGRLCLAKVQSFLAGETPNLLDAVHTFNLGGCCAVPLFALGCSAKLPTLGPVLVKLDGAPNAVGIVGATASLGWGTGDVEIVMAALDACGYTQRAAGTWMRERKSFSSAIASLSPEKAKARFGL